MATSSSRCRIERQAPMFCGSSCAHTISRSFRIRRDERGDRVERERVELLDARHGDAGRRAPELVPDDVVVHLAAAEDEAPHLGRVGDWIVENRPKAPRRQGGKIRRGLAEPKQALRGHDDERACRRIERLAAEQVEVLPGCRAVDDADVVLRRKLQEPLETRARVLRAVAFVAVREQQRESGRLPPLRATRDDELVDHDLGAVDEVAELGLPEDERVRGRDRVTVLEGESRILGERRVVDLAATPLRSASCCSGV